MEQNNINWEERRFLASLLILTGLAANQYNFSTTTHNVNDAVFLADTLISILSSSDHH